MQIYENFIVLIFRSKRSYTLYLNDTIVCIKHQPLKQKINSTQNFELSTIVSTDPKLLSDLCRMFSLAEFIIDHHRK